MKIKSSLLNFKQILPAIILVILVSSVINLHAQVDPKETMQKFGTALQIIEFAYVDSTDAPDLVETAIVEML
ncbi:MAG: hypothetical protein B6D64_07205, partial [Bacteroidetes bacterium 4484_276]